MNIEKIISPFIQNQFPSFYNDDGPNFIAFVKAYYEWMETQGQAINVSRSLLENIDIDDTNAQFISHFKSEYIDKLPDYMIADKKLVIKYILNLYRTKGTKRSYELLFRMLYNEPIDIYIPGDHLLKPSDNSWVLPKYIEVSDSKYLSYLIGKKIYNQNASAIVEDFSIITVNNKVINVLLLSNLINNFLFDEQIFCDDLYTTNVYLNYSTGTKINSYTYNNLSENDKSNYSFINEQIIDAYQYYKLSNTEKLEYSIAINYTNAPIVFGSLSSVGITNGGVNYNKGDIIDVIGLGNGGKAKIVSTKNENGKVTFQLINGGYGYTRNAQIYVTGGYGSGATFKVGDISDISIIRVSTDKINDYYETQLDIDSIGIDINIDTSTGDMSIGEYVVSTANVSKYDASYISGSISVGDVLSNTSLGISGLYVYDLDNSLIRVTGSDTNLNNSNIVSGTILNNTTGSSIIVNSKFFETVSGNGVVYLANSSHVYVNMISGGNYFIPTETITGLTSGKTANVTNVNRLTDWGFTNEKVSGNLDNKIENIINILDLEIGKIAYINNINPGVGYSASPSVSVIEPLVKDLQISDGNGNFWGNSAVVTAIAGFANGIVTGIEIIDSGFGYQKNEVLLLNSNNNTSSVTGFAVIERNGVGLGYWESNKSFVSDKNYIQDGDYYQLLSYDIISNKMMSVYENVVKNIIHPSGIKMFGSFKTYSEFKDVTSVPIEFSLSQS
jgi:hypothetical protein